MTAKTYWCPNCGRKSIGQRAYVDHLLQEAGPSGVTTNQFLAWGAGSRFGARVHELRHEDGRVIDETNGLYVMAKDKGPGTAVAMPEQGRALPLVAETTAVPEPTLELLNELHRHGGPQCAIFDDWEAA